MLIVIYLDTKDQTTGITLTGGTDLKNKNATVSNYELCIPLNLSGDQT